MFIEKDKFEMPELLGGEWVNSEPIGRGELKGRVVLVDFWDYTCVNCIRTLPYLAEWHSRYSGLGLAVIGVHAPEFLFARSGGNVKRGIEKLGIDYPVVLDNDYRLMHAFSNKYWPAKYLADKDGYLRYAHYGEGSYLDTELAIQLLLREMEPKVGLPDLMRPVRDTDIPGIPCYRVSPELYFGYKRGRPGNPEGVREGTVVEYKAPFELKEDTIYFGGKWLLTGEYARPALEEGDSEARVHLEYTASELNVVMNPEGARGVKLYVMQEDDYLSEEDMGRDVKRDPEGRTFVAVEEPGMYNLVRNRELGKRRLRLSTTSNACAFYAFTFVSCTV